MKLFGFNLNLPRRIKVIEPPVRKSLSPEMQAWLLGEFNDQTTSTLTNAYQQVVWVYRAVNVLAEQVANIPFLFSAGDRGRENLITTGPLTAFYNRPAPNMNRFQYWELRVMYLMLRGECFRVPIHKNSSGSLSLSSSNEERVGVRSRKLEKVLLLDPSHFHHIVEGHQLVGWRYTGFGNQSPLESQVFLPEEVWFEKLPNPFDFWRGMSPLTAADLSARTDFAAGAFMKGLMENNADLGVIVRTDQQLSEEQREQLMAALRSRKRKAGTADRPLLLWGGAQVEKPQLSSSDLQFLENRKFSRSEICAAFGVPEEIITTTDKSKYDVMQGARLNFIENRVAPLCRRLEAEEDITVRTLDPKATGWFDLDSLPIMQEAQRTRLAAAKVGFDMGVPFNELNRVFDLGFKALPWGNTGYLPTNVQEVGSVSPSAPSASVTPPPTKGAQEAIEHILQVLKKSSSSH